MESVGHGTGVRVTYLADAQSRDAVRAGVNWIVLCNTYICTHYSLKLIFILFGFIVLYNILSLKDARSVSLYPYT